MCRLRLGALSFDEFGLIAERNRMAEHDLRPPQQQARRNSGRGHRWLWALAVLAVVAVGVWYGQTYWAAQKGATQLAAQPAAVLEPAAEPEVISSDLSTLEASPPTDGPGLPLHPLPGGETHAAAILDAAFFDRGVLEWLGQSALQFVVTPGLAYHVVATVDNLPRGHAAPRLWPLSPVGGKILLEDTAQGLLIAPNNSARYDGVVNFVTGIDPAQAAAWYRQTYPLLQQTYQDLGYPGKYFNDRLVEVIDHLLLTPEPTGALTVDLVQVHGQIAPQQPWLRYEFADDALEKLSAGQKILLRLGTEHRQKMKTYLQAVRAQVAGSAP